jgi:hypothetical protein
MNASLPATIFISRILAIYTGDVIRKILGCNDNMMDGVREITGNGAH